jgi:HSP20 family protein
LVEQGTFNPKVAGSRPARPIEKPLESAIDFDCRVFNASAWDSDIVYALDLPGIAEEKISVELDDGALTISAERERTQEESDERFYRFERRFGTFSRTFGVPQGVTESAVNADYKNGVLEVHVRKPEQPKPKRIQVGSTSTATIEGKTEKK